MPNFIDEYLIRLGASVDQSGLNRFHMAIKEAAGAVDASAMKMATGLFKAQTEIVGGFAAIGVAAVGLADKVAMADQEYRLFALHMYMSKDAARGLKVAMDALGQPLENLTWDPELRGRTIQLLEDQRRMAPEGDFEAQMHKLRDIRFEFTRMEVEAQYLAFHVVQDFLHALGTGPDQLLAKLRAFNTWVIQHLPQISQWIAQHFLPVWKDVKMVLGDTLHILEDMGLAFTDIVGALSGDRQLESATFSFEKFADAVAKVVHWLALAFEFASRFFGLISGTIAGGGVGGTIGSLVGGVLGLPGGPAGVGAGMLSGGALGTAIGGGAGALGGGAFDLWRALQGGRETASVPGLGSMMPAVTPDIPGVDPDIWRRLALGSHGTLSADLLHALAYVESGSLGMAARSARGAIGVMQLMPDTASDYGVNPYDLLGNLRGGAGYLSDLLKRYGGNVAEAVGAYNAGQGRMDQFLAGKATLPAETQGEIARVLALLGQRGDVQVGTVTIHITDSNDPQRTAAAVKRSLQDRADKRVQRNQAEFQGLSYSY